MSTADNGQENSPSVFVSYSHDSDEHKKWVLSLAINLRSHGVDAILDQWDARVGSDLPFFMEKGLTSSSLVLCVCSERYTEKANGSKGGAGYEKKIMSADLLEDADSKHIIPIIRNNPRKIVPTFLRTNNYIDFSDDTQYVRNYRILLERIYDIDETRKPPLGKNPFADSVSDLLASKKASEETKYRSYEQDGLVAFQCANNDHVYILGYGDHAFRIRWNAASNSSAYIGAFQLGFYPHREEFPNLAEEVLDFDFTSTQRQMQVGDMAVIINEHENVTAIKLLSCKSRSHGAPEDEVIFEYKILPEISLQT